MKQTFVTVFSALFLFLFLPIFFQGSLVHAAYLKFDQTSVSVAVGATYQAQVVVDAGTDQITSTDVWVVYDTAKLEVQTVSAGTFFPTVTNNISSGKVYIAGLIVDPGTYKTGSGTVATITFRGVSNGTTSLTFDCRTEVSNSSKIIKNDVNATNVIVCSQNGTQSVNVGGTSGGSSNPTSTPAVLGVAPTVIPTQLPQSGIAEHFHKFIGPGIVLFLIGISLRFLLL